MPSNFTCALSVFFQYAEQLPERLGGLKDEVCTICRRGIWWILFRMKREYPATGQRTAWWRLGYQAGNTHWFSFFAREKQWLLKGKATGICEFIYVTFGKELEFQDDRRNRKSKKAIWEFQCQGNFDFLLSLCPEHSSMPLYPQYTQYTCLGDSEGP